MDKVDKPEHAPNRETLPLSNSLINSVKLSEKREKFEEQAAQLATIITKKFWIRHLEFHFVSVMSEIALLDSKLIKINRRMLSQDRLQEI